MAFSFRHPGRVSFFPPLLSLPPLVKFSGYQSRSFTGSRDLQTLVNQVLVEKKKKATHIHTCTHPAGNLLPPYSLTRVSTEFLRPRDVLWIKDGCNNSRASWDQGFWVLRAMPTSTHLSCPQKLIMITCKMGHRRMKIISWPVVTKETWEQPSLLLSVWTLLHSSSGSQCHLSAVQLWLGNPQITPKCDHSSESQLRCCYQSFLLYIAALETHLDNHSTSTELK